MEKRTTSRVSALVGPLAAAALILSACGGEDSSAATRPTVELSDGETSYATIPPATTIPTSLAPEEAAALGPTTEYEVQAGDYGIKVAEDFGITLGELEAANGWDSAGDEFPGPGSIIRIPASAEIPEDDDETPEEAADTEPGQAIEDPGDNCEAGSYEIESGDFPISVAEKFDVDVNDLNAANAGTTGYDAFYPGLKIVIPPKADC